MDHSSFRHVIAIGTAKEAALYFERVFPFDMTDTRFKNLGFRDGPINPNAIPFDGVRADRRVIEGLIGEEHAAAYDHYSALCLITMVAHRHASGAEEFNERSPLVKEGLKPLDVFSQAEVIKMLRRVTVVYVPTKSCEQ